MSAIIISREVSYEATVNGRRLVPGTEASITGLKGRFRFIKAVTVEGRTGVHSWLDFWGGPKGCESWRSVRAEQVKRVHRLKRTGTGLAEERKGADHGRNQ